METIKKKICLSHLYSRQKSRIPFAGMFNRVCSECGEEYEGEITANTWVCDYCGAENDSEKGFHQSLNWGKPAYSVNFDKLYEISGSTAVDLYGDGVKTLGLKTFQELVRMYHDVLERKVPYIEKIERGEELTEEEEAEIERYKTAKSFIESKMVIDEGTGYVDPCCDPCQPEKVPTQEEMDYGEFYVEPFAFVNIGLVQSQNLIGAYTFSAKDWYPGRRYFSGDRVIYDGKTFVLKDFDNTIELSGSTLDCNDIPVMTGKFITASTISDFAKYDAIYEGISEDVFNGFFVDDESEIVDFGYIYAKKVSGDDEIYFIRPSWGGYLNILDGIVYFDKLTNDEEPESGFVMKGEYETEHWAVAENIISHGSFSISSCSGDTLEVSTDINRDLGYGEVFIDTGFMAESKLDNFRRNTKTITTDGTELPGKLYSLSESKVLDLPYLIGSVKNVDTTGDVPVGDYLADIHVIPETTGLISIYLVRETGEPIPIQRYTPNGKPYTYTHYNYTPVEDSYSRFYPEEEFPGSIERSGNSFKIYDEQGQLVFDSDTDIPGYDYEPYVSINGKNGQNIIDYEGIWDTVGGYRVQISNRHKGGTYSVINSVKEGKTSLNGDGSGFFIQPTGGTEDEHNIIADNLLPEYSGSPEYDYSKYILFQTLNTYERLVENWADKDTDEMYGGERGKIIFRYFMGAELELEKDDSGNTAYDAGYVYNGGRRQIIYEDEYNFVARYINPEIDGREHGEDSGFVYLDIDYASKNTEVIYENIYYQSNDVILSKVSAATESIVEGGKPVSLNFQNSEYFMEDYKLGISFVADNNENVYIDRGNAAAFERHLRLSEANTMEDLDLMGNGMFKMKQ